MGEVFKAFNRLADGSWACIAPITLEHPQGRIQITAGTTFARGAIFMGVDVAAWLEESGNFKDLPAP